MKDHWLAFDVRQLILDGQFSAVCEFCNDNPAPLVAEILSVLTPQDVWQILAKLPVSEKIDIFSYFEPDTQVSLAKIIPRKDLAEILTEMSADDRVDLLKDMTREMREAILPAIAQAEREEVRRLFAHKEGTAGSVMTSEYATVKIEDTAAEAIARLRLEAPNKETIYVSFVVNELRQLLGVVSLKDLILAAPGEIIKDVMDPEVVFIRTNDDQEEAARKIQKFDLLALPILDDNDNLVGIITHDDAVDVILKEHTEDLEKFMAITGDHEVGMYLKTSAFQHFKNRATWIVSLAALGLVSGSIIHSFEKVLSNFMILALYMPMVADTGGNVGSQSATVIVRALAVKEVSLANVWEILWKEFKIAFLISIVLGLLSFAKVMFLSQDSVIPAGYTLSRIGFVIALALSFQVISATLVGAILPLAATKFDLDPAIVASPALTTIVDITGLILYFSTAKLILGI